MSRRPGRTGGHPRSDGRTPSGTPRPQGRDLEAGSLAGCARGKASGACSRRRAPARRLEPPAPPAAPGTPGAECAPAVPAVSGGGSRRPRQVHPCDPLCRGCEALRSPPDLIARPDEPEGSWGLAGHRGGPSLAPVLVTVEQGEVRECPVTVRAVAYGAARRDGRAAVTLAVHVIPSSLHRSSRASTYPFA